MKINNTAPVSFTGQPANENEANFIIGDVFRGKILDMSSNELSLKINNGSVIKASFENPIDAKPGDFVDLKVKSIEENRILVETVKVKTGQHTKMSETEKALHSIGKEITPQNIEIAKTLIDNNIKFTAEGFNLLSETLNAHKSQALTAPKAIFLIQNNLPVNAENIELLNSFLNKKLNIVESLTNITSKLETLDNQQLQTLSSRLSLLEQFEELPKLINNITSDNNKNIRSPQLDKLIENEILNISTKALEKNPQEIVSDIKIRSNTSAGSSSALSSSLSSSPVSGSSSPSGPVPGIGSSSVSTTLMPTNISQTETLMELIKKLPDNKILNLIQNSQNNDDPAGNPVFKAALDMLNVNNSNTNYNTNANKFRQNLMTIIENMSYLEETPKSDIINILKSTPDKDLLANYLSLGKDVLNKLLSENPNLKSGDLLNADSLSHLISKDKLSEILINSFKQSLSKTFSDFLPINIDKNNMISEESLLNSNKNLAKEITSRILDNCFLKVGDNLTGKDIDVKDIYEKLLRRLALIDDISKNNPIERNSTLTNNISTVDRQISFLNSINNNQTYIQIPLIYDGNKNGELYIIKKKRSGNDNNANGTTVYLSLNTINLGRFETLVNVNDNKLKINIRLEKDDLVSFVKENYTLIYNLLEKTKFKIIDIKCKKTEEELDPISIDTVISDEFTGNSKSIDFKV